MHTARRRLERLLRLVWRIGSAEVRAVWRRLPLRRRTVLYESFAGNGALCNPEALFRALLTTPDMADLRHVWVLKHPHRSGIRTEFAGHPRVRFVRYKSVGYFRALATSGFLINNATFPPEFGKRTGQIYLNTWHGTPLKRMGYDMPDGALESANTLRNFVSADYLLSQNPFMTHRIYEEAYRLRGVFPGLVIEEGAPRVDRQFLDDAGDRAARAQLEAAGIPLRGREIILFAPTWRGESFASAVDDADDLIETVRMLQRAVGDERYIVLLKSHQIVHRFLAADAEYRQVLVPNSMPSNSVLGITRLLVTDYSSIFFDFLATGRPILFYVPDSAAYGASRGTYFGPESLPGPVLSTIGEVASAVRSHVGGSETDLATANYAEWRERFVGRDDGGASARVIDAVFRGRAGAYNTVSFADTPRESLVLHLGSMNSNGITTSALNLLTSIDHDSFDVSAVFTRPTSAQQRANQRRIDPRVRQFHRVGRMNGSLATHLRRRLAEWGGKREVHRSSAGQRRMWDDEWRRCFGEARFDRIIDFDGYGPFWATLALHGPASEERAASRSIWLHNDLGAETHRLIRGRERLRHSLQAVFALYHEFDALVSVSPSLAEVNRRALAAPHRVDPRSFVSARNLVDDSRIRVAVAVPIAGLAEHRPNTATGGGLPGWAGELGRDDGVSWFITLGRFSTEKNQARLIRAFALTHRMRPETRLLLIGYGPLRDALVRLIQRLELSDAAFVAGPYDNPYALLAAADCFVLSSDYEGQPMVLLEAALVGLPIVSVNFDSIRDALPESTMTIVDQSDESLAEGMLAFLNGEVTPQRLDVDAYNLAALQEFLDASARTPSPPDRTGE